MNQNPPLRRNTRPRAGVVALALLAVVMLAPSRGAQLLSATGDVEIGRGDPAAFRSARAGDSVAPGDIVRTGHDGRAELDLGRATVRLYPNSLLRVPLGDPEAVGLERGRSLFDVLKRDSDPFEVQTPEVVVSVKGTRFSVALADEGAAVAVFRGMVGVRALAAEAALETLVREGFVAAGREHFELSLHGLDDPWRGWGSHQLPNLPEPALRNLPAQASAAVSQARTAALAQARPEAVAKAAERHPEVAERLARVRAGGNGGKGRGAPAPDEIDAVSSPGHGELRQELEEGYVETYINNPNGPGGGGTSTLELEYFDGSGGSGGERLMVTIIPGGSMDLDEDMLEDVLDGSGSLPPILETALAGQGITPEEFAEHALSLFD